MNSIPSLSTAPEQTTKLIYPRFSVFVLSYLKQRTQLSEIIKEYEKNGVKLSHVAYWKNIRKLHKDGKIKLERHEELWLIPMLPSGEILTTGNKNSMLGQNFYARVHSTHKIKLSMPYTGLQPMEDASNVRRFGRYGTAHQAIYEYDDCTIGAYKHRLVIWVRNPVGIRTEEQRINAKLEGYRFLKQFANEHNLKLEGYLDKVELSHHVVENDPLNEGVKKLTRQYGKEIFERLGTHECKTSHPGRIEHEGRARTDRIVRGDQVAIGLEYLTLDFKKRFEEAEAKIDKLNEFSEKIELYTEQISLHLDVEKAQLKTQEETQKTLKAIQKGLVKEEIK